MLYILHSQSELNTVILNWSQRDLMMPQRPVPVITKPLFNMYREADHSQVIITIPHYRQVSPLQLIHVTSWQVEQHGGRTRTDDQTCWQTQCTVELRSFCRCIHMLKIDSNHKLPEDRGVNTPPPTNQTFTTANMLTINHNSFQRPHSKHFISRRHNMVTSIVRLLDMDVMYCTCRFPLYTL